MKELPFSFIIYKPTSPRTHQSQNPRGTTSKLPSRVRLMVGVGTGEALGELSRPGPFWRLRRELLAGEGTQSGWAWR